MTILQVANLNTGSKPNPICFQDRLPLDRPPMGKPLPVRIGHVAQTPPPGRVTEPAPMDTLRRSAMTPQPLGQQRPQLMTQQLHPFFDDAFSDFMKSKFNNCP